MLKMSSALLILSILVPFSLFISCSSQGSEDCGTAVYWGQNGREGNLLSACNSGFYKYVSVAFLTTFGSGQTPVLNLASHCDPQSGTCRRLYSQIQRCQSLGIKVLLALGGATGSYNISSPENAREVAEYLWDTYLNGSTPGPLGQVALDGVDFAIENPGSTLYWDDLARALAAYSTPERKIYLAASTQCAIPDRNLHTAIKTGVFDNVYVRFYNNSGCEYSGGAADLLTTWNLWSSYLPSGGKLFLGLPASPDAAGSGYIPWCPLRNILPVIGNYRNYGGVTLWDRYYDVINHYSRDISGAVCTDGNNVCQGQQATV